MTWPNLSELTQNAAPVAPVPVPPQAPAPPQKGAGLAITALVIGIISLLLSWVPIINNGVFFLALIGLAFGIPALVGARRGKRSGTGMATAAVVLLVLSLVGVLASQAFYGKVIDDVSGSIEQASDDAAAGRGSADEGEAAAAEKGKTLALGQSAEIGDYTVKVTKVVQNADAIIKKANEFNDAPKNQYVLVEATVTYNGGEEGIPDVELQATIAGSDGRQYDSSAAAVVTPLEDEGSVTLTKGGTSKIDFAMDVPAAALKGGKVLIQETFNLGMDERSYWPVG